MKHEWRKEEKALYLPKGKPEQLSVTAQKFFSIRGKGDPNKGEFAEKIGVLYSLAYAVRMMPKSGYTPEGYEEYMVYPLEAVWSLSDEGQKSGKLNKDEYLYNLMVRQPDFVTREVVDRAFEAVRKKKPHPFLDEVVFGMVEDGLSVQMLHAGAYDDEPASFEKMDAFLKEKGLQRRASEHREIYVTNVNRENPEKQKTVLRYFVCSL